MDTPTTIILAGGQGMRLRPMTEVLPKPLVRVADRPLLEHILYNLHQQNLNQVVLATGYKADAIEEYFGSGSEHGVTLQYVVEENPLGSGGAIRNVAQLLPELVKDTFLVTNADVVHNVDFHKALQLHRERGALATIICCEVSDPSGFGICAINEAGQVTAFHEKPPPGVTKSRWANLGLWIFEPEFLNKIKSGFSMVESDLFPRLIAEEHPIFAYQHEGFWLDVGTPERYLQVQLDAMAKCFPCDLKIPGIRGCYIADSVFLESKGTILAPPLLIADNCTIQRNAEILSSVIGAEVFICGSAAVQNSVIYNNAVINCGARICRSIIGPSVNVPENAVLKDTILFNSE